MAGSIPSIKILQERVASRIEELDFYVRFWRRRAFLGHIGTAGIGALIAVIAGLKGTTDAAICNYVSSFLCERNNLILVLGAIITILSSWQAFYRHRDRWITYDEFSDRLRLFLDRLDVETSFAPSNGQMDVHKLFGEYEKIITELNQSESAANKRTSVGKDGGHG